MLAFFKKVYFWCLVYVILSLKVKRSLLGWWINIYLKESGLNVYIHGLSGSTKPITKFPKLIADEIRYFLFLKCWILYIYLETDPYVTIKCEGETVKSSVVENSLNPEFNFSAIFYRKDPDKDILVQVL